MDQTNWTSNFSQGAMIVASNNKKSRIPFLSSRNLSNILDFNETSTKQSTTEIKTVKDDEKSTEPAIIEQKIEIIDISAFDDAFDILKIKNHPSQEKQLGPLEYKLDNMNKNNINIEEILGIPIPAKTRKIGIEEILVDTQNEKSPSESKYSQTCVKSSTDLKNKTLESINKKKRMQKRKNNGTLSRLLLHQDYWTYVEIWSAISFFAAILMFGWFYLIPYLYDEFYLWIYPNFPFNASFSYRTSMSDICFSSSSLFHNIFTAKRKYYY